MNTFEYQPNSNEDTLTQINQYLWDQVKNSKQSGKGFEVCFKSKRPDKTYDQLRGIHRLCGLLAIRFGQSCGTPFDSDSAKLAIKLRFGYTRQATTEECLAEAINQRANLEVLGIRTSNKELLRTIETLKKDLVKPKSFAEATLEEMRELIEKIEALGQKMEWPEIELKSDERRAFEEFYRLKDVA